MIRLLGTARVRRFPLPEIVLWTTASQHPSESQTSECSDLLSRSRATFVIAAQRQPGKLLQRTPLTHKYAQFKKPARRIHAIAAGNCRLTSQQWPSGMIRLGNKNVTNLTTFVTFCFSIFQCSVFLFPQQKSSNHRSHFGSRSVCGDAFAQPLFLRFRFFQF